MRASERVARSAQSLDAMASPAIDVRRLSKIYRLYGTPHDRLKQMALWRFGRHYGHEFWALREVSFSVRQGEAVGIIGRNGSGKSTLLQILAGTLQPTSGQSIVAGRVAALLELGSGFNPEFTGRENVFLNGNIMGLRRSEIEARFDEIAAFADIGEFIEQPVKVYSSGMFVRLAFAVQTILPKDVLIVDEALAVGDEAFQRKCYAAMERFRANGGTVLLVSHSSQTIVRHTDRCLLLSQGELLADGPSKPVTDMYQKLMYSPPAEFARLRDRVKTVGLVEALLGDETAPRTPSTAPPEASRSAATVASVPSSAVVEYLDPNMPSPPEISYGSGTAAIRDIGLFTLDGRRVNCVVAGRRYVWSYVVEFGEDAADVSFGMMLKTVDGLLVVGTGGRALNRILEAAKAGDRVRVRFQVRLALAPGTYFANAGVSTLSGGESVFLHRRVDAAAIRVMAPDSAAYGGLAYVEPALDWEAI